MYKYNLFNTIHKRNPFSFPPNLLSWEDDDNIFGEIIDSHSNPTCSHYSLYIKNLFIYLIQIIRGNPIFFSPTLLPLEDDENIFREISGLFQILLVHIISHI